MMRLLVWGLHIKKEPTYKGRDENERQSFMEQIDKLNPSDLVFCDEMGVDNNICTLYGWSEVGKRSYGEVDGFRSERRSIVAGHVAKSKELVAPIEYKGFMDTTLFNDWLEKYLCPALRQGQYVILDNASFHKSAKTKELIEKAGCYLLFLPKYSPDLNPIEHCWANLKNYLRKIIDKYRDFASAITEAMTKTFPG